MRLVVLSIVASCSYAPKPGQLEAPDGETIPDGPMTDAQLCFTGFTQVCLEAAPGDPLLVTSDDTIATDGPRCAATTMGTAAEVCVVAATRIEIAAGITLRATGPRPLLLLATTGTIQILGTLDVASHIGGTTGAGFDPDPVKCPRGTAPTDSTSGGGGYGGTFGGAGGNGGRSVNRGLAGVAVTTLTVPTTLRAGCGGANGARTGFGAGGAGGGAVELNSASIQIVGVIDASGAGGGGGTTNDAGGGGGGSGGMIVFLTAQLQFGPATQVFAQGGGGGGGAGGSGAATSGMDPTTASVAAPAGDGFHGAGGTFGAGGVGGTTGVGAIAQDGDLIGGGGGGGGAGVIKTLDLPSSGAVVPPFS